MRLYAYDSEDGTDPHAVELEISQRDYDRMKLGAEKLGRNEIGGYVSVTDQLTGRTWHVASAPCGLGCHCAAVAVKLEQKLGTLIEDAIDHSVRAFSEGLSARLVGRTITEAKGEVFSSEGEWDVTLVLDDGSTIRSLLTRATGPVADIVRMAGGNPFGGLSQEKDARECGIEEEAIEW